MKVRALFSLLLPLLAAVFSAPVSAQMTEVVCMETNAGEICLRLFPQDAPKTVANFLNYVNRGAYDNTVIHRTVPSFVIQGGGFRFNADTGKMDDLPADPPVVNEFKRSNVRGTIAMAKLGNDPNSATNEWFINLNNNGGGSAQLDVTNGGFTVFGEVVLDGMNVADAMTFFQPQNASGLLGDAFAEVSLINFSALPFVSSNFLTVNRVYVTERDLSGLGSYAAKSFAVPVRIGSKIYRIIFNQTSEPPLYVFQAQLFSIVEHKDVGQQTAVYAGDTLTIPSLRANGQVLTDIVMRLTNVTTLEFTLESFKRKE